jgi:putative DNA primase/helicase
MDRHSWIRIGMALKAALGDAGFELWDAWSSTGAKYDASEMHAQWRSFQAEGGISTGTLFYFAKRHGWRPPARQRQR